MPFDFGFPLRPYQLRAIQEVEKALEADRRQMLLAMATGTGKTKLAIALLYRLLPPTASAAFVLWLTAMLSGSRRRRNSGQPKS
jgi:type I site-specific restriction endonuclease